MIEYIDVKKLHEHPDNPRKALGDLSELSASIKKQGLLQNLTVVPHPEIEGEYRILIGHRRFNAAKMAGLKKLPCMIDRETDHKGQIAVMMSENMQRNDLTIAERVGGVQMMMDLGMDEKSVSESTGLSFQTVKRYKKLTGIRDGIGKAEKQGATLTELALIADIEYEDLRKEALEKAGTQNINHVLYKARTRKEKETRVPQFRNILGRFAVREGKADMRFFTYEASYNYTNTVDFEQLQAFKPKADTRYIYTEADYGVTLYKENKVSKEAEEKRKAAAILRERAKREGEIAREFQNVRRLFMTEFRVTKTTEETAKRFLLWILTTREYIDSVMRGGAFDAAFMQNLPDTRESYTGAVPVENKDIDKMPERLVLTACVLAAYDRLDQGGMSMLEPYSGKKKDAEKLVKLMTLYGYLEKFGYRKSEEEEKWLNGTHECFTFPHEEGDV